MNSPNNKTVIIVLGPTAVGKTGASIRLAKALHTEIISADSMQIYRRMDIGTAKPSPVELNEVPHHLINILNPDQSFSAGMFRDMSAAIINDLHKRSKIPVVTGGTGLYIRSLTQGLFECPPADWSIRAELKEEERILGKAHLYERLRNIDAEAAAKIHPGDTRRIIRAIEVAVQGGKTISELHASSTIPLPYHFIKIGLFRERKELYSLIEKRIDKMMKEGLLHETEKLLEMNPDRTALQALGYKEMRMHLQGDIGLEEAVRLVKKRTKMYAKRQVTWFKKEPAVTRLDITGIPDPGEIFEKMLEDIAILRKLIYS